MSTVKLLVKSKSADNVCEKCGTPIVINARNCSTCDNDVGYPNVRMADTEENKNALKKRLEIAEASAKVAGYFDKLHEFGETVKKSKAVICTSLINLERLTNKSQLFSTFYQQMDAESRTLNSDDHYELLRNTVDSAMFPQFHKYIHFAAISLNDLGVRTYGPCHITLKNEYIKNRATVFEENSCLFYERYNCYTKEPKGYRAVWEDRHLLAKSKLHAYININILPEQFPPLLIQDGTEGKDNFIEVHIYGHINSMTFESVKFIVGSNKHEKNKFQIVKNKLISHGVRIN